MLQIVMGCIPAMMEKKCNTHNLWHELNKVVDNYLSKITINNLVESNKNPYIELREIS